MLPVNFVDSLCKIHAVSPLCSKIAGIEVHGVRTWKFVYFRKIFRFLLHNTRDVTGVSRGHNSPGAKSLPRAKKSQQRHKHFFQYSTFASKISQVRTWVLQTCLTRRHLTSLRPWTPRLSRKCWTPRNAVDYRSHLTIGNNLKVEKRYIISKTSTTFSPPQRNAWCTRRDKHTKKLESNNYGGTLFWKVFIAS